MPLVGYEVQHLRAAEGFAALGMYDEANAELEEINASSRTLPEVLAVRVEIYYGLRRWELMQVIAKKFVEHDGSDPAWHVALAYSTRRIQSIDAAKAILIEAARRFPKESLIHYNLACYDCQLDRLPAAKEHLDRAFRIQPKWRARALADEDLRPLWDQI